MLVQTTLMQRLNEASQVFLLWWCVIVDPIDLFIVEVLVNKNVFIFTEGTFNKTRYIFTAFHTFLLIDIVAGTAIYASNE